MGSISETGHAKNMANFNEMLSFVSAYDTDYKPAKASIRLAELQTLSNDARNALTHLNAQYSEHRNAKIARDLAFKPLNKLITVFYIQCFHLLPFKPTAINDKFSLAVCKNSLAICKYSLAFIKYSLAICK